MQRSVCDHRMMREQARRALRRVGVVVLACCLGGCAPQSAAPDRSSAALTTAVLTTAAASSKATCPQVVVALDPGHNPVRIDGFDPVTGASQIDYPNGAEDADVFAVATRVRERLQRSGYRVVMLKTSVTESVTYRQRVGRAVAAHARVAISIHTSPGANAVFVQRVGLYREGTAADGTTLRITYRSGATAAASQRYGQAIADARTRAEGLPVMVTNNDFGGRAPLWTGNIPMIALMSDRVPWVYNEFGLDSAGGSTPLPSSWLARYAQGIAYGVQTALPVDGRGCAG